MSRGARRALWALIVVVGGLFYVLALLRWATFHNETFDLAFYARISWALARFDPNESIVGGHFLGLHISPVLLPLGWLGHLFGQVPVLLLAQSAAVALTAWPLASVGARRFGDAGGLATAIAWLLYPNVSHVATFEMHPGTLAVLPIAWALDAVDRGSTRGLVLATLGVIACREDLAMVTAMIGLLAVWRARPWGDAPSWRGLARAGWWVAGTSVAYVLLFALVIHPAFAPEQGSMELHFGRWGTSAASAAGYLLTHPGELIAHLAQPNRLLYLPKILAPLALLPLLAPRWLLAAAPVLAINLVSVFPTTTWIDSHYLTPAVPVLIVGAVEGAEVLLRRLRSAASDRAGRWILLVPVVISHLIAGGTPASAWFVFHSWRAFVPDGRTDAARAVVARIPPDASVQGPDELLPHLAERRVVHRGPPPERQDGYVVLRLDHRRRLAHDEDVLRVSEEPLARNWLSKPDHGVLVAEMPYVLLRRGLEPRAGVAGRYFAGMADPEAGVGVTRCLAVLSAQRRDGGVELALVVREACPADLAVRIGAGSVWRPGRVDLLFDGLLSPAHLRRGDRVWSFHRLYPSEQAEVLESGLRIGALRSSGARVEPDDPTAVTIEVR